MNILYLVPIFQRRGARCALSRSALHAFCAARVLRCTRARLVLTGTSAAYKCRVCKLSYDTYRSIVTGNAIEMMAARHAQPRALPRGVPCATAFIDGDEADRVAAR